METLLRNTSVEMLREYYFDAKGEYPPADFTKHKKDHSLILWHPFKIN